MPWQSQVAEFLGSALQRVTRHWNIPDVLADLEAKLGAACAQAAARRSGFSPDAALEASMRLDAEPGNGAMPMQHGAAVRLRSLAG